MTENEQNRGKDKKEREEDKEREKDKEQKEQKDKNEEDKEKEKDKEQKEQKDKNEEDKKKVRKEKAQFHQQESSSPRLPCSGSSWCNILCAGAQQQQQPNFLSYGLRDRNANTMERIENESGKEEEGGLLYVTEV